MYRDPTAIALLLTLVFAPFSSGQEKGEDLCGDCHTTGRVERENKRLRDPIEKDVEYCSVVMRSDPEALGLDWVPCPKCRTPSVQKVAQAEFDRLIAKRRAWLDELKPVEDILGHEAMCVQTKHFRVVWEIPKIKIDRQTFKQHEAMHLYAERAEKLHEEVLTLMGMEDHDMVGTRHTLYLFELLKHAKALAPVLVQMPLTGGQKVSRIGTGETGSAMVSWDDPEKIKDDEDRYQHFVHSVSHHIHNDVSGYKFWLFKRYGWVYEGLAYYHEVRDFGSPVVSCSQETGGFVNWKGKSWEANVKKSLLAGEEADVATVMSKGADQLTPKERQFAWSYIDYLMWEDPNKMPKLLSLMKVDQVPTRDALKSAYGLTMGQFIDNWTAFVRDEYSTRARKGPAPRTPKVPPRPRD